MEMQKTTRIPSWLIGGAAAWLAFTIVLSILHVWLLNQWGVPFSIQLYSLGVSEGVSLAHALLLGMVAPGFFILETLAFLHVHIPWLDAAIYNWRTMVLLSSIPVFLVGACIAGRDRRVTLFGAILGLLLLGGSLLFILNQLSAR